MPQIIVKNADRNTVVKVSSEITEKVASIIGVPHKHIVVEYTNVEFFRCGEKDTDTVMFWVSWKKRTPEMQEKVAKALSEIMFREGYKTVETVYDNLDMNDFYEYSKETKE